MSPTGLAVDPSGTVYVSSLDGAIQKISGGVLTTVGSVSGGGVRGIAYDPSNGLLYITVQNYDAGGAIYTMPTAGGTATLFASGFASGPNSGNLRGLAFGNGNLYVADGTWSSSHDAGTMYKFAGGANTAVLFASGLQGPNEIAIDALGNLYVAEYYGDDIHEFSASGTDLGSFVTGLAGPSGIALDSGSTQSAAPEPGTLGLLGAGVLLLAARGKRIHG